MTDEATIKHVEGGGETIEAGPDQQAPVQGIPILPLPMEDQFQSITGPQGQVYVLQVIETPVGTFKFLRERDYHMEVMSAGRKAAGGPSLVVAPAGSVPGTGL